MKKLNYITLFSCAGIGCYGFHQEDYDCIATVEIDKKRLQFQKYNNVCTDENGYIAEDFKTERSKTLLKTQLNKINNDLDVLIATPPCQGISTLNKKKTDKDLVRNSLVVESIKSVLEYNPKFFIFENVKGFLNAECTDIDNINKPIKTAIETNLNKNYDIVYNIVNLKDYGVPSSRTRTIVVGTRKDIQSQYNIDIDKIFPEKTKTISLMDSIGHLKNLNSGEIDENDILHFSKVLNEKHFNWIKDLKQGESAFNAKDPLLRPHKIGDNGEYIPFNSTISGKYTRQKFEDVAKCVHTYTANPNSQFTLHPVDTRVFSVRELMIMMSVPNDYKVSDKNYKELNNMSLENKTKWLNKNEGILRTIVGEAVPTLIFNKLAKNIKKILE